MKKAILVLLMASLSLVASSQTFDEWFRQKETQKKYLLEQIVALQVFNGFLNGGYRISKAETDSIVQEKNGEYRLHQSFFLSLKHVSGRVKSYKRSAVISYASKILAKSKQAISDIRLSMQLTPEEISHTTSVFQFLIGECLKTIDELIAVTTDGEREMREDERIQRIDEIYQEIQSQYSFCCTFRESVAVLSRQREAEQQDVNLSKSLNGLK